MKTVNYLLAMEKSLRERLKQLDELKTQSAKRTIWERASESAAKREEPTYDIKKVDAKITAINKALFTINHEIKASNARTTVEINVDYDTLMEELV